MTTALTTERETETALAVASSDLLPSPIYQDSLVQIYHGDSREIMPNLPRGLVVTDPPYNVRYHYEGYDDNMSVDDYQAMLRETCPMPCVIIHYAEDLCAMAWTLEELPDKLVAWVYPSNTARQWRCIGWWGCKPDFRKVGQPYKNPKDKRIAARIAAGKSARLYDWWEVNQVKNIGSEKTDHPCQIPEEVMRRVIKISSPSLVLDPFAGSGTTLVAAKQLGVKSIGVERSEKYCAIAASRIAKTSPPV